MNLPDFLVKGELGEIRLSGHRIDLLHVVERYREGFSPEMLREQFPTLPLSLIHKVLAFYLENQDEVDAYVTRERTQIDEAARTADPGPSLQELRRRANAARGAEHS
jgi:uncharacterized protein (DUF433 family)